MKSIAGLAGLLHLYQDEFAPGHANLHPYDGQVDLQHILGDMTPPKALSARIVEGSSQIIRDYMARCRCTLTRR